MNVIIVDTDILIDFLRGRPQAREFLLRIHDEATACCSAITVGEIFAGMRESEEAATRQLIAGLSVMPVTQDIAEKAGELKRLAKGHALELDDCLIAASAMLEPATLATKNARHYPFDGLRLIVPKPWPTG